MHSGNVGKTSSPIPVPFRVQRSNGDRAEVGRVARRPTSDDCRPRRGSEVPLLALQAERLPAASLMASASLSRQVDCGCCRQVGCPRSAGSPPDGLRIARLLVVHILGRPCSIISC
jgi:hypothetical protein